MTAPVPVQLAMAAASAVHEATCATCATVFSHGCDGPAMRCFGPGPPVSVSACTGTYLRPGDGWTPSGRRTSCDDHGGVAHGSDRCDILSRKRGGRTLCPRAAWRARASRRDSCIVAVTFQLQCESSNRRTARTPRVAAAVELRSIIIDATAV